MEAGGGEWATYCPVMFGLVGGENFKLMMFFVNLL